MNRGESTSTGLDVSAGSLFQTPLLSVVLVNWNTLHHLIPCLRSIFKANIPWPFEVIVVDNNSTDTTKTTIPSLFPQVRLIENQENLGFATAVNQGARQARGEYLLLLNPDTVVDGTSLQTMVKFMQQSPDAGVVGGALLNTDGSFQASYARFSSLLQETLIALGIGDRLWRGYPSHHRESGTQAVDWICGACLLVRRRPFLRVGCLDEEYVMYSEEVDLQYRLQRKGWKTYYLPHVRTVHHGGGSQGRWRRRSAIYRGKLLFYRKNLGRFRHQMLRLILGLISLIKLALWMAPAIVSSYRGRASAEVRSNLEVLKLCWKTA
jgi:N-acetylglucosaminyl-diphospho-decaprenol L-rhamnosyltransferase